jgi:hypothetical protein
MSDLRDYPALVFILAFVALWSATQIGVTTLRRQRALEAEVGNHYGMIVGATLTLLSLIIGFSFSMAVGRYDQRKNCEAVEANTIGTEYLRAQLLPAADATQVRTLLKRYLDQRVLFYSTRDEAALRRIEAATAELQAALWAAVRDGSAARPTQVAALAVQGMNEVIDAQGYTQAAWWNQIPIAAWVLMAVIAFGSCLLVGYGARHRSAERLLLLVVPLLISLSLFLIADIDSPSGGVIRVSPQNLISLAASLAPP